MINSIFENDCDISCLICENNNCIKCNIEKGYYPIEGSNSTCYSNDTILKGYFLDKNIETYIWKKCHDKCETCLTQRNDMNMNCLSCKANLNINDSN